MDWYVVHTKPRQEQRALLNLQNQGYTCFLPWLSVQKLRRGALNTVREPLFPRYLFVRMPDSQTEHNWVPIRSTLGVTRLVTFGSQPARIGDDWIDALRQRSSALQEQPRELFEPGQRLQVTSGAFAGLEVVFQMADGDSRVIVLIELLSKATRLSLSPTQLRATD